MSPRASSAVSMVIPLNSESSDPLYRQLYCGIRRAILSGRLPPGGRVPSTRALAADLGISRNTALLAFDQLFSEGYLIGRVGGGTYVACEIPDHVMRVRTGYSRTASASSPRAVSHRGAALMGVPNDASLVPARSAAFRPGVPALDAFPMALWARVAGRRVRRLSWSLIDHGEPGGYLPLRQAVAAYVAAARGVRCEPGQVIIVGGTQQALELAGRVLLDPGDSAWLEDPGHLGARGALVAASARIVPVAVDGEGIDVRAGAEEAPEARLAYASPSHQYPLGVPMSLNRRLGLLQWASESVAWVLEDDYDSEYRYAGRPLMSLQGLDTEGRVIYLGTFSKTLFPALRIGYLIAPGSVVDAFLAARAVGDQHSPTLEQAILSDFIAEGHYARHIRRMRSLYRERQEILVEECRRELGGLLAVGPSDAGMHLVGWLPEGVDDRAVSARAAAEGVVVPPLSRYYLEAPQRSGLLLGYAAASPDLIRKGVRRLTVALERRPPRV